MLNDCVHGHAHIFVSMHCLYYGLYFLCIIECNIGWQSHLLVAVTHVDVPQDLDRAGFLHHNVWYRVVWGQLGEEPVHSAAL